MKALEPWGLEVLRAERAPSGLIQETWFVDTPGGRLVAQRLHPIFGAPVLEDTEAVTAHLAAKGVTTPRLVRTRDGALGAVDADGRLWRVCTYLDGFTVDRVAGPEMARAAAGVVARFHRALADLEWEYRFVRPGVHDTAGWLRRLAAFAGDPLADAILAHGARLDLGAFAALPRRHAHGDLKISNVLFVAPSDARALLDLDTLGSMPLAFELGDAWRSWCNPLGEDVVETRFDLGIFAAAVEGYAAGGALGRQEAASLVPGIETIALELAARFCVDIFEDRYFGWDPQRFPSRREHNRVRAAGQLAVAGAVAQARGEAEEVVRRAFDVSG